MALHKGAVVLHQAAAWGCRELGKCRRRAGGGCTGGRGSSRWRRLCGGRARSGHGLWSCRTSTGVHKQAGSAGGSGSGRPCGGARAWPSAAAGNGCHCANRRLCARQGEEGDLVGALRASDLARRNHQGGGGSLAGNAGEIERSAGTGVSARVCMRRGLTRAAASCGDQRQTCPSMFGRWRSRRSGLEAR